MASGVYNIFKKEILREINLETDSIKVALLNNSHVFDPSSDVNLEWGDISSNEVTGTGYTSGGKVLTGNSILISNLEDKGIFDADDVVWASSTITAYHAVMYNDTTATKYIIASIDFGQAISSTNGNFQLQWDNGGIITLN